MGSKGMGVRAMGESGGGRILCNRKDAAFGELTASGGGAGAGTVTGGGAAGAGAGEPVSCWTMLRKSVLLML